MKQEKAVLIFPHQMFESCALLDDLAPADAEIFILEEYLFFRQYRFHKQKLVLHRASMRRYADHLKSKGYRVTCVESKDLSDKKSLADFLARRAFREIAYTDMVDNWLERRLRTACERNGIKRIVYPSPMFVTSREDLDKYVASTKRPYFMRNFYVWQRKRLGIMLDEDGNPEGGKWWFDTENRKRIPKGMDVPAATSIKRNTYVEEAMAYVESNFPDNVGTCDGFNYATDFEQARKCVRAFLQDRLADFGPYEDAIDRRSHTLFHSVLSPYLNVGLLRPDDLVRETLGFAGKNPTLPIESLEGFIRQVIGWREYMRLVYEDLGTKIRNGNYFGATREMPGSFWTGSTGIDPLDHTIGILRDNAYCHHIPRLMVLGNFMNLCGFRPDEVYAWFMEFFIDSYDWVMVPNVYSMALYADGGLITTKPYVSSSNYVRKMSDYGKGSGWGERWDALYWSFIDAHFEKLQDENRLGFVAVQYRKLGKDKLAAYRKLAKETIAGFENN